MKNIFKRKRNTFIQGEKDSSKSIYPQTRKSRLKSNTITNNHTALNLWRKQMLNKCISIPLMDIQLSQIIKTTEGTYTSSHIPHIFNI